MVADDTGLLATKEFFSFFMREREPFFKKGKERFMRNKERRENRGIKRVSEKIKVERVIWSF